jgi:DNA-binding NarL/FixJ family response regulator
MSIPTYVHSTDPISRAGVVSQLRMRPEIKLVGENGLTGTSVAVVISDQVDEETLRVLHRLRHQGWRLVLIAKAVEDSALVAAAEAGVSGLVRRADTTADVLVHVIERVASGNGEIPPDLLGRLLEQVGRLQRQILAPRGLTFTGLSPREADVLKLVADGHDTSEIAATLCYSERTVKNVLHDVTTRLQLRNRSHAVAYAVREGLI